MTETLTTPLATAIAAMQADFAALGFDGNLISHTQKQQAMLADIEQAILASELVNTPEQDGLHRLTVEVLDKIVAQTQYEGTISQVLYEHDIDIINCDVAGRVLSALCKTYLGDVAWDYLSAFIYEHDCGAIPMEISWVDDVTDEEVRVLIDSSVRLVEYLDRCWYGA